MSDSNRDRELEWREACDSGALWWSTGDPDSDVMLSEDEHFAAAAAFEEAAKIATELIRENRPLDIPATIQAKAKEVRGE